ncbi:MAG: hypothetical protein U0Q18_28880 [Bryobacteraceae bacterium]
MTHSRRLKFRPARWLCYLGLSIAILIPCFWQQRIQAGDLSSHIYNAWLVQLIEQGRAGGLIVKTQTQNVLFDLMLSYLLRATGADWAQRAAVSAVVLIFFWGAFSFVWSWSRRGDQRPPWHLASILAMLAFGWVYHMGLFNFYLSLGFSLAALAAARRRTVSSAIVAGLLLAAAFLGHALPPAWAIFVEVYTWLGQRVRPRQRPLLAGGAIAVLIMGGFVMKLLLKGEWGPVHYLSFSGAEQIWTFGNRYLALAAILLAVWGIWLLHLLKFRGARRLVFDVRLQLCALNAAFVLVIPSVIDLPGAARVSLLITRMSLAGAILFCGLAASAPAPKWLAAATGTLAVVFFTFTYQDEAALNRIETRMERAVRELPPGSRVVTSLVDTNLRMFSLAHIIDRACIGRCFSYANYEPSTGVFRVRAERPNAVVVASLRDSWAMQVGGYTVKPEDLPMYRLDLCEPHRDGFCAVPVKSGEILQRTWLRLSPGFWQQEKGL